MDKENKIVVGKINGFYGVKGDVKIFSYGRPRESILHYKEFYIDLNNETSMIKVERARSMNKHLIMKFESFNCKESVLSLLGKNLLIKKSQLPKLDNTEYYWIDLMGMNVINLNNEVLGIIDDILETGANDVLVIKNIKDKIFVPYIINRTVIHVDFEKNEVLLDWEKEN